MWPMGWSFKTGSTVLQYSCNGQDLNARIFAHYKNPREYMHVTRIFILNQETCQNPNPQEPEVLVCYIYLSKITFKHWGPVSGKILETDLSSLITLAIICLFHA